MQNPTLAWIVIGVGVFLVLVSALANALGIAPHPGFGWKKTSGVAVGALLILAGLYLWRRPGTPR